MSALRQKTGTAISLVLEIALSSPTAPITAKTLVAPRGLQPRSLESLLQALVYMGVLKGCRGPRGGYMLARHAREITVADVFRAAKIEEPSEPTPDSPLLNGVVVPALAGAEHAFSAELSRITIEDLVLLAKEKDRVSGES
ncbi:MAG TPA: Rrf2 family transcriptional regulator [Xanthobacteraceae bacterium]|jgi:Rrf2 family protein